jgi:hypothetical protein
LKERTFPLQEIYEKLVARGQVRSLRRFSESFLGKAPNYMSDTRDGFISPNALIHLAKRLRETGQIDLAHEVSAMVLSGEKVAR